MGIKISVGVSEQGDDRDRLERRRKAPSTHGFRDEARPNRRWAWPLSEATAEVPSSGPQWAW